MKKKLKIFTGILAVLILCASYSMPGMLKSSIPSAYYITPSLQNYENTVSCSGTVQAAVVHSVYASSPMAARQVHVSVGDRVQTGDLLATIDVDVSENLAGQSLEALRELDGESVSSSMGVDWAALASMYGLSTAVNGITGSVDYSSLAALLEDTSVTDSFPVAVEEEIAAPISGVVIEVGLREDSPAGAGKALFTIADTGSYKVMATVNEGDIAKIQEGNRVSIRGVAFGGKSFEGEVVKIYPTARRMLTGTTTETVVDVEIALENPDEHLKPGFSAKVEIAGDEDYDLLTVPYEAVRQDDNNDEYVYVYRDGSVQKAPIVTGQELANEVQVLSGLDQESVVLFNPGGGVQEGAMIHIKGRADVH